MNIYLIDGEKVIGLISAQKATPDEGKSMRKLSKEQRRDIAALAAMKDSEIDLTDMQEVLDWSGAEVGRFYGKKKTSTRARAERKGKRIRKG